ncbi:reverse transcriptase domain-containing protein [Tanacetum coccineum]
MFVLLVTPVPKACNFHFHHEEMMKASRKEKANDKSSNSMEFFRDLITIRNLEPWPISDPCEFTGITTAKQLALRSCVYASINLMPYSVWKSLSLPELTPTCMTLELADRSITEPIGIAEDVFVNVGKFQFPADFVARLPFVTAKKPITLNLDQSSNYTADYNIWTVNKIDVIDMACDEYSQEVLGFSNVIASGNPTPYSEPIVSTASPTLTPFGDSDFLLFEEADSFLALEDDPTSSEVDPTYQDPEGDILILDQHFE